MVIVGVVGEVVELIVKWIERWKAKSIPKKELKWVLPIETVFFLILVVGLAMEFWGSHKAMRIADDANAALNAEAGDARKEAGEAIKQAALANERSKQLESTNVILRLDLLSLETVVQWRTITAKQETNLIEGLSKFIKEKPTEVKAVTVGAVTSTDAESVMYALRIAAVLREAGFDIKMNPPNIGIFGNAEMEPMTGLEIDESGPEYGPCAVLIIRAFRDNRIQETERIDTNAALSAPINIRVWAKPER
jgi:hypothetical protein